MDAAKWSQDIGLVKPMEDMVSNSCSRPPMLERKTRPPEQLNCPRCNSTNTKFCYYNNYSLTQPRYFCKTCRRYWTEGGSLRNVPVGGGSRKNKRSSASPKVPDLNPHLSSSSSQNHIKGRDLNLGFPAVQESGHNHNLGTSQYLQLLKMENNSQSFYSSSALELLRTGMASRGLNSFIPTPSHDSATATATATLIYSTGFCVQDYKPSISFSMDGRAANIHGVEENGGRVFFPFGEMKSANEVDHQNKGGQGNHSGGYWNNNNNNGLSW